MSWHASEILASAIHNDHLDDKDVYCLGPYTGRINFLSQQYRALNLAWALGEMGKVRLKTEVAIIGAGLSGITMAAALLVQGAHVTVFEAGTGEVYRQATTRHRIVYPALNWWPHDPNALNPTSDLPFLNWRARLCSEAVSDLLVQWRELHKAYEKQLTFRKEYTYLGLEREDLDDKKPQVKAQERTKRPEYPDYFGPYDLVVLAVGFAPENTIPNIEMTEYWREDQIEADIKLLTAPRHWIVSGFGDGGMIDALRLSYEFQFGELAYQLALALHDTGLDTELAKWLSDEKDPIDGFQQFGRQILKARDLEKEAEVTLKDATSALARATTPRAKESAEHKIAESKAAMRKYRLLRPANALVKGALSEKKFFVSMVDANYAHPLLGQAAPIYKLMVAMAMASGVIKAFNGKLTATVQEADTELTIVSDAGAILDGPYLRTTTKPIVRNGAGYALKAYATEAAFAAMINDHKRRQDFNFRPAWPENHKHCLPDFGFKRAKRLRKHIVQRGEEALKMLDPNAMLVVRENAFELVNYRGGYRPTHLLGLPITKVGGAIASMPLVKPLGR